MKTSNCLDTRINMASFQRQASFTISFLFSIIIHICNLIFFNMFYDLLLTATSAYLTKKYFKLLLSKAGCSKQAWTVQKKKTAQKERHSKINLKKMGQKTRQTMSAKLGETDRESNTRSRLQTSLHPVPWGRAPAEGGQLNPRLWF